MNLPDPYPWDTLRQEILADIASMRAKVEADGVFLNGRPHPLFAEIKESESLLARLLVESNLWRLVSPYRTL